MNEHYPGQSNDITNDSPSGLDVKDDLTWAEEMIAHEMSAEPPELNEVASRQKAELDTQMNELLTQLKAVSQDVRDGKATFADEAAVVLQMEQLQLEELPKIYAEVTYENTRDYLKWHAVQENDGWCQLACVQNAFRALGDSSLTQTEIALETHTHERGRAFTENAQNFVRNKGLGVEQIDSVATMIDSLLGGSKVVLATTHGPTPHAILVSGVLIESGKIDFIYNDPAVAEGAQTVPLDRMLKLLEPPLSHNAINRSYTISPTQGTN